MRNSNPHVTMRLNFPHYNKGQGCILGISKRTPTRKCQIIYTLVFFRCFDGSFNTIF